MKYILTSLFITFTTITTIQAQTPSATQEGLSAKEIIQKVDDNMQGESSTSTLKMSVVRPRYTRTITLKSWSLGKKNFMGYVTAPAREKGQVTMKVDQEMWQYTPSINRLIKLPPSMMSQGFMGSDYSNDDLVKQSSIVEDYKQTLQSEALIDGHNCYVIKLIPHKGSDVVWSRVIYWVDKENFVVRKSTYYDEENILVRTIYGKDVKLFGTHYVSTILEIIPAEEPENKTIIETLKMRFNVSLSTRFFTQQRMKRIR